MPIRDDRMTDVVGAAADAIGVDWGTSSFRAFRLEAAGTLLEGRRADAGIMAIDDGAFEEALEALIGDWLDAEPDVPVILSGMIGSRQGWQEVSYLECPAAVGDIAAALTPVSLARGRQVHFVPGLIYRDGEGVADVMRGEEVQILGAMDHLGATTATVCLPGTHSKWAEVVDERVIGFATHMTGEVFDVMRRHSILGRMIEHSAWDDRAFRDGVARSGADGGLLHHLFGVRATGLTGGLTPETAGAFLSGLVIGHEVRSAAPQGAVHLVGDPTLTRLYAEAMRSLDCEARVVDVDAAARGLARIARAVSTGGSER